MKKLTLQSNAKVNLSLDILGRENTPGPFRGYHFIQTVLHEITPRNTHNFTPDQVEIEVEEAKTNEIQIRCNNPKVPTDEKNLAHKAAAAVLAAHNSRANSNHKITITIEKNIPISSGLGGGSSNAAVAIKGLNALLNLNLSTGEMKFLAAEIGMDAPFFIEGGIALAEHYGEQITTLPPVKGIAFTLFPEEFRFSGKPGTAGTTSAMSKTKDIYSKIDLKKCGQNIAKTLALIHAIKTNDHLALHENLHNDFETLLPEPLKPNHHLAGSGPTTFILA